MAEIKIEVDLDAINDLPLEALELFDRAGRGELSGTELLDLLDGIVVGGVRNRGFKLRDLRSIAQAVSDAVKAQAEGGVSAGA